MADITNKQFGWIIAFQIPGFIGLFGLVPLFPVIGDWLRPLETSGMGIGPTVYLLLAALALGMILSCIRWLLIDHLLHWFGVKAPAMDFTRLEENLAAWDYLNANFYRYYQFYSNTLIAILWGYMVNRLFHSLPYLGFGTDLGVILLLVVLFLGSRDALRKYYTRSEQLLRSSRRK